MRRCARVHADRAAGRDRDHRRSDRPAVARGAEGARGRGPHDVLQQPQADGAGVPQPPRRARPVPVRRRSGAAQRRVAGGRQRRRRRTGREQSWSWAYNILPYIEQDNLHKNPNSALVRNTPVKTYYCPSRRSAQVYNGTAKIDYAGNAGTSNTGANGVVMRTDAGRDPADRRDSTARTARCCSGEKQMNRAAFGQSTDDNESYCTPGWNGDWEVYRVGSGQPAPDFNQPGSPDRPRRTCSARRTPTGFNAVFCDGSVRFIRYSVNRHHLEPGVYPQRQSGAQLQRAVSGGDQGRARSPATRPVAWSRSTPIRPPSSNPPHNPMMIADSPCRGPGGLPEANAAITSGRWISVV